MNRFKPTLSGKMTFAYGRNKRSDIKSKTTLEAIKVGERTATTRYTNDGHLEYWRNAKVGDIIRFEGKDGESVLVQVTKPLTQLPADTNAEEWSQKEGWSVEYYNKNVLPKVQNGEAW